MSKIQISILSSRLGWNDKLQAIAMNLLDSLGGAYSEKKAIKYLKSLDGHLSEQDGRLVRQYAESFYQETLSETQNQN